MYEQHNERHEQIADEETGQQIGFDQRICTIGALGSAGGLHRIQSMLNKKNFPTLILVLVSLAAILFSFAFFWRSFGAPYYSFVARYGAPPPNQSAPNFLQLGVFGLLSGLALDALIWLGVGIDHLLARIPKTSTRLATSLGVYLILPGGFCICLPAALIWAADAVSTASNPSRGGEQHFVGGFLTVLTLLPAVFGWVSIYVGAGTSALSRWLAARIWREP